LKTTLVCFSGIDGSGKTTLCKEVVTELRSHRISSRYVYGRFLPVLVAPLFKLTSSLMPDSKSPHKSRKTNRESKKHLLRNPIIFKLFVVAVLFDQLLRVLLKVSLPSLFKREVIICDRYLLDTIVTDVALTCDFTDTETIQLLRQSLQIFPKADIVFLVNVPPRIAFQRKSDMHSIESLERLSRTYLNVARKFGAIVIDGTKTPEDLKNIVLIELESIGIQLDK